MRGGRRRERSRELLSEAQARSILEEEEKLRWQLSVVHENQDEELKSSKLLLKSLQLKIWELRCRQHNQPTIFVDTHTREKLIQMQRLIGLKSEALRQLEDEKYNQAVDREKLVVLHKYQESGVEVHHAYTKYIQSENLKSLRDLPHSYRLLVEELELEVECKLVLKRQMEDQKKRNEELITDLRKQLEEATSFHHSLQKQVDQQNN